MMSLTYEFTCGRTALAVESGEFYGQWTYDHFNTLTFSDEVSGDVAMVQAKRWIRRVEKLGQGKAHWLITAEIGECGRMHCHALTINTRLLADTELGQVWHAGGAKVETCRDSRAAATYVMKYAGTSRLVDYDCSLPPLP